MKITSLIFRVTASAIAISVVTAQETIRVLDSKSVQSGGRTITFQRIEPPAPKPTPAPVVLEVSPEEKVGVVPWRFRRFEILSLSCTVKESGVTSVRWWHKGKEYRILSSIDFNLLRGVGSFSADVREYMMFMGIGNEMSVEIRNRVVGRAVSLNPEPQKQVPPFLVEDGAKTMSRYIIEVVPESGAEAEAFLGIDDLHRHFDAHRAELIAQAAENEARQKEHAAYLRANPPVPKSTTFRFWPKTSEPAATGKEVAQ